MQTRVGPRDRLLQFLLVVVALTRIDCGELAAIQRDEFAAEKFQLMAEQMKLAMHQLEAGAVIAAEIGDGLEVGRQFAQEPDDFQIALTLALQRAAGAHTVQVAVEIKPQQIPWMIRRGAGVSENGFGKTQREQIERSHEGVDETHGVFRADVIFESFGQEQRLCAVQTGAVLHG